MTKREESLNLNLAESSEAKSLVFPVSLCKWKFLTPVIDICSSNTRAFIISKKVNGKLKANTDSLNNASEYAHYW